MRSRARLCSTVRFERTPVRSELAVHIGARVAAKAAGGEAPVSRTVVDPVAGSELTFDDRGELELKGVSGTVEAVRRQRLTDR
jgi:class 3 adenylate cyclase